MKLLNLIGDYNLGTGEITKPAAGGKFLKYSCLCGKEWSDPYDPQYGHVEADCPICNTTLTPFDDLVE